MESLTRRKFVKLASVTAAGVLCTGSLASCSTSEGGESNQEIDENKVTVVLSEESEPESGLDPLFAWGCGEAVHPPIVQSTLFTISEFSRIDNDLAQSFGVSSDGLTWTVVIRSDVKFTNNQPLVAGDVAFTVNGVKASASSKVDLSALDYAEAQDGRTVVFHLLRPCSTLRYSLAVIGIVPMESYDPLSYGTDPTGSGPYKLELWERGEKMVFSANEGYYGDAPIIKRLVVKFRNEEAACAACNEGRVDIAMTTPRLSNQSISGYSLLDCQTYDCYGISLPIGAAGSTRKIVQAMEPLASGNDITSDKAFRQALCCGFDRKTMISDALKGYASSAYGPAWGLPWSQEDMRVETDLNRTETLLDSAGWQKGSNGKRSKNGQQAKVNLYYLHDSTVRNPVPRSLAKNFSSQMAAIGIEVETHSVGLDDLYAHALTDLALWEFGNATPADMYDILQSRGTENFPGYANAETDAHLAAAEVAANADEAFEHLRLAQWDEKNGIAPQGDAAWVWLADVDHLYFKRNGLNVGVQRPHTRSAGWSLVGSAMEWSWEKATIKL